MQVYVCSKGIRLIRAIILAGGFGTRLRSVVADVPKAMASIHGKPFLVYLLNELAAQGFTHIIFSVFYQWQTIQHYFGDTYSGMSIRYVVEEQPLGTGGAIQHALKTLDGEEPVFIMNGDTFVKLHYAEMYEKFASDAASQLMLVASYQKNCERYGRLLVDNGYVSQFKDKGTIAAGYVNAGVYLCYPQLFNSYTLPLQFSFEKEFLSVHVSELKPQVHHANQYFIDIGVPEDYQRAEREFVSTHVVTNYKRRDGLRSS